MPLYLDYPGSAYSFPDQGQGILPGLPFNAAQNLHKKVVEIWPDQAAILALAPQDSSLFRGHWYEIARRMNRNVNSTPQAGVTAIEEHTPRTYSAEKQAGTTTVVKDRVTLAFDTKGMPVHYMTPEEQLGKMTQEAVLEMTRGFALNILTAEHEPSVDPVAIRSCAGMGVNTAGTALRPLASAFHTTSISDTNLRMNYFNSAGAGFTEAQILSDTETIRGKGGVPKVVMLDIINKKRFDQFRDSRDRINFEYPGTKTNKMLEVYDSNAGQLVVHVQWHNYPSRAVVYLDLDPEKFFWGPVQQKGLKIIRMGLGGDSQDFMIRAEAAWCWPAAHCHGIRYNTAA